MIVVSNATPLIGLAKIEQLPLPKLLKNGIRGKYAVQYREGANLVLLEPDVAKALLRNYLCFIWLEGWPRLPGGIPDEAAVNEALRLVIRLTELRRDDNPNLVKA